MNAKLLKYFFHIMSGKKKDDSEAVGIMKSFKSTEIKKMLSSKEPRTLLKEA